MQFERGEKRAAAWALATYSGMPQKEIAEVLDCSVTFIREWKLNGDSRGHFRDQPRDGRPRVIDEDTRKEIVNEVRGKRHCSTERIAARHDISPTACREILHSAGLRPHRLIRQPALTQANIDRRLEFAEKYLHHPWRSTWISDEKQFSVQPRLNPRNDVVWDIASARHYEEETKYPVTAMAWAAISYHGKTRLYWIEDHLPYQAATPGLDAEGYISIIEDAMEDMSLMIPRGMWFQQDGAKIHTADKVYEWLDQESIRYIPRADWPPNSPDLSPIENVWGIIDAKIKAAELRTKEELKNFVECEWDALTADVLRKLIDSIPLRLRAVMRNRGLWATS